MGTLNRKRTLELIESEGVVTVREIMEHYGLRKDQRNNVYQQLKGMRSVGLISRYQEGVHPAPFFYVKRV